LTWTFRGYLIWYCGGVILCSPLWDLHFLKKVFTIFILSLYLVFVKADRTLTQNELVLAHLEHCTGGLNSDMSLWGMLLSRWPIASRFTHITFHCFALVFGDHNYLSKINVSHGFKLKAAKWSAMRTSENVMFQSTPRRSLKSS